MSDAPATLSAGTRAILTSIVPAVCPPEAWHLAAAIVDHMALTLGSSPPLLGTGLALGLATYDLGALPRYFTRARHLDPARAERYFASWEHGITPIHVQLARGVKQLMSLACYEQPEMMERLGYRPGPWIEEVKQKRLTVHRDAAAAQESQVLAPDPLRPGVRVVSSATRTQHKGRA